MSRGHRRRRHRIDSDAHAARGALGPSIVMDDGGAGTVLTLEGEDVPLASEASIDLVTTGKKFEDGVAKFRTRKADPMRPFNTAQAHDATKAEGLSERDRADISERLFVKTDTAIIHPQISPLEAAAILKRGSAAPLGEQAVHEAVFDAPPPVFAPGLGTHDGLAAQRLIDAALRGTPLSAARVKEVLGAPVPPSEFDIDRMPEYPQDLGDELIALTTAPKLARVQDSCFHKIVDAWAKRELMIPCDNDGDPLVQPKNMKVVATCIDKLSKESGIFLLQHDWARAFAKATDYEGGEIKLPYALTVVECSINHHRVCLVIAGAGGCHDRPFVLPHYRSSRGWAWLGFADLKPDFTVDRVTNNALFKDTDDLVDMLLGQLRAVLIALEAEVATADVVRAPYKLNQKREKAGKLPLFDYHVINLAARKRYTARLPEPGDQPHEHHRKRLHFVRGHYRHFENHKTWIKWHLRGDPDLGFIDKEYRL